MDRRGFLRSIGLGIGGIALEQAIPLGRVWSFPKKIVIGGPLTLPPNPYGLEVGDAVVARAMLNMHFYGLKPGDLVDVYSRMLDVHRGKFRVAKVLHGFATELIPA